VGWLFGFGENMDKQISELKAHPSNAQIYGDALKAEWLSAVTKPACCGTLSSLDEDLLESIRKHGILTPLIITQDDVIISGHRRWNAAKIIAEESPGRDRVPVVVSNLTDDLDIQEAIIATNKQRQKTNEQIAREFQALKRIEAEKAKERQAESARRNQPQAQKVENFPPSEGIGKSRDIAAEKVGLSGRTAEKAAKVVTQVDNLKAEGKEHQAKELKEKLQRSKRGVAVWFWRKCGHFE